MHSKIGKDTVNQEAEALVRLSKTIDTDFDKAIEMILKIKGKVIITGVGKSGHISRKISSTMTSTGTPSYFIHPTEASHGDLGAINDTDLIIALSNSGESDELISIINYSKRFKIPLIALTSNRKSSLSKSSDITLEIPDIKVTGISGIAPTSSSTMMLALGDAIAIALLKAKGFTEEKFKNYHPGGKIGSKLVSVSEIMHIKEQIPIVFENDLMSKVLIEITQKRFGCAAVVNDNKLLTGIITDGDLRRNMNELILKKKAIDIMNSNPIAIPKDFLVTQAISVLNDNKISALFISDSITNSARKIIGIIHMHDCLKTGAI